MQWQFGCGTGTAMSPFFRPHCGAESRSYLQIPIGHKGFLAIMAALGSTTHSPKRWRSCVCCWPGRRCGRSLLSEPKQAPLPPRSLLPPRHSLCTARRRLSRISQMPALRVEICNERFLPRFGVDRLLVLLGGQLAQSGHQVSFTCLRCDPALLAPITADVAVLQVPPGLDMAGTETAVMSLVARRWQQSPPQVLVIGGWPFFEAASRAESFGVKSIFIDAGAVAQNGLPQGL